MEPSDCSRLGPAPERSNRSTLGLRSLLVFTFALGLLFLGLGVFGIQSYLRLGSEVRALRNGLLKAAGTPWEPWERKIELRLGALTVAVARTGLLFAHLEPRARTALRCIRAGEVGIYELKKRGGRSDRAAMLLAADKVMDGRGWDRLIGVIHAQNLVAVYVPKEQLQERDLKVCVAVIGERRLLVASARIDSEALMELIGNPPERGAMGNGKVM